MPTRYQQLRQAIARLASAADEQHAYLESILSHLTPDGEVTGYGNDELALEFGDIYMAVGHMRTGARSPKKRSTPQSRLMIF